MGYKIAIIGATGNVGREVLNILDERKFPADEIVALASSRSAGRDVTFGERGVLKARTLEGYDFKGTDIVFACAGGKVSKEYAPKAAKAGAVVIDKSSHFRMEPDVPLVVPEVNPEALKDFKKTRIIASPNCSTIQMVVALKPLHDAAKIKRIVVSTYQSVSGAGREAMDELFSQTKAIYVNDPIQPENFTKQIAFNVIPQIDTFLEDGNTKEEMKMVAETRKILDSKIKVTATCVRVPVFVGHSESVNIEFENEITAKEARKILRNAPGVTLLDNPEEDGFITPVEASGEDDVYVSRVREDSTVENGLNLWIVSDNLRKGAALNAVQIAEKLVEEYL